MSGHTLNPSRSHASTARASVLSRLADRIRGHGDLPAPDEDLQDFGDGMDAIQALEALAPLPAPPWAGASQPGQPAGDDASWRGQTLVDGFPAAPRRYVPDGPGRVSVPDPGPQADLGSCPVFRAAVHAQFARQERARGTLAAGPPWHVQYARVYRQRTGLIPVREPDFALHRWDGVVDQIVAESLAAVEAEWLAAGEAQPAPGPCPEYAGRHASGSEAA